MKNVEIDIIISSPLKRARQTADIINEEMKLPIIIDNRISERDFGEFEGKSSTDFNFDKFWSYKQNEIYSKAEISEIFLREYMIF